MSFISFSYKKQTACRRSVPIRLLWFPRPLVQEAPQDLRKFLHIVTALLLPPEGAVIPGELPAVPEDRQAADRRPRRREGPHALNGQEAPVAGHQQPPFLQILRKQVAAPKAQGVLVILLFRALLLPGGDQDAGDAFQIFQADLRLPAEGTVEREFRTAAAPHQLKVHIQVGERAALVIQNQVHTTEPQQVKELLMGPVDDADGHLRIELREPGDGLMQFQPAVAAQIADAQPELMVRSQPLRLTDQVIRLLQDRLAVSVKILPGRGQRKLPAGPVEQFHAQLPLQGLDLLGDCRLGDMALLRSLRKAAAVHNGGSPAVRPS